MNNSFGEIFKITIFGSSHAEEVGIIVDGLPNGLRLTPAIFDNDLNRRRPSLRGETTRCEEDIPTIEELNNVGTTCGNTIRITFKNKNTRSNDYSHLECHPRPSHADLVQRRKYGDEYNLAGGGMASGRMTVALVAAGVVAKQIVSEAEFETRLIEVGGCNNPTDFEQVIAKASRSGDSVGGIIECRVKGTTPYIGEPFFDSVESVISHLLFSIPGVKGVEFGDGFAGTRKRGSERNDTIIDSDGHTLTNNEGGINGGIANGNDIILRVAIKPTPSISREQQSYNFDKNAIAPLTIGGRHDACIARRAAVVIESMVAVALADLKLRAK